MTRCQYDPTDEGIQLAQQSVTAAQSEDGLTRRDAIKQCLAEIDLPEGADERAWVFTPYGDEAEAVRDSARSQLRAMLADCDGRKP